MKKDRKISPIFGLETARIRHFERDGEDGRLEKDTFQEKKTQQRPL
jgi:hypothetical protein